MPTIRIDPLPRIAPSAKYPVTVNIRNLPANGHIETHSHTWAQLACTIRGAVRVRAGHITWIVPPTRAVWIPPRVEHEVTLVGEVALRTVYVDASAAPRALTTCEVIDVSSLMRELIETLGTVDRKTHPLRYELLHENAARGNARSADLVARSRATGGPSPAHLVRGAAGRSRRQRSVCRIGHRGSVPAHERSHVCSTRNWA